MVTSKISEFYKKSPGERLRLVREFAGLDDSEVRILENTGALAIEQADRMVENAVGTMPLPLGIAVNFLINDTDYLIPMALEEPSVIAAASNAAKMARTKGGFRAETDSPVMIGQIQLAKVRDPDGAKAAIESAKDILLGIARGKDPLLVKAGGGPRDIQVRILRNTLTGPMVIVHILVDCGDAMGANAVNTMAEAIAPHIERMTGGKVYLRILSNLAVHRLARASAVFSKEDVGGEEVVDAIIEAYAFAEADPFRCATHNKGIMNGVDAVVIATGNDFRAVEAGAHSFAAYRGGYRPLTKWEKNADGDLVGSIELPMAVGLVGGATKVHPTARLCVKILGVKTGRELAGVIAAVGLAQNFAALRALATEGIQRGHMALHARNIAASAGAGGEEIDLVAQRLVAEKAVRMDRAKELLDELRRKKAG